MLRNFMVTGVVASIMAFMTLAIRSVAPPAAQPSMDGKSAQGDGAAKQGKQPKSGTAMKKQTSAPEDSAMDTQGKQNSQSSAATVQKGGGMMGGGQARGNMMMCPCMQMMMGGMNGGQMNSLNTTQPISNPRTKEQAEKRAEEYLKSLGNPNLKVGAVRETAASYEIDVVTKDNSLVNRLIIDKQSGNLKTQY